MKKKLRLFQRGRFLCCRIRVFKGYRITDGKKTPVYDPDTVFSTKTNDHKTAQKRAQEHLELVLAGKYRLAAMQKARSRFATLADVAELYRELSVGDLEARTVSANINCLYNIVRTHYPKPELEQTTVLTAGLIHDYKREAMQKANGDYVAQESAKRTANSIIRQARSVFTARYMEQYEKRLRVPELSGFLTTSSFRESPRQYRLPDPKVMEKVKEKLGDLKKDNPGAAAAILLALNCGLRAGEICAARWTWVIKDGDKHSIRVGIESDFRTKNLQERKVPLGEATLAYLHSIKDDSGYLIPARSKTARENLVRRDACKYLKDCGFDGKKKLHEVRKLFGAEIATKYGLYASQKLCGHKDPKTTSIYYADLVKVPDAIEIA